MDKSVINLNVLLVVILQDTSIMTLKSVVLNVKLVSMNQEILVALLVKTLAINALVQQPPAQIVSKMVNFLF